MSNKQLSSHRKRLISGKIDAKAKKAKKEDKIILAMFIIIIFLVALRIIRESEIPGAELQEDAEKILNAIATNNLKILNSDQIDEDSLEIIMKKDYAALKNELGLKNDFCIFFYDEDGNPVKIGGKETGIGSDKLKINGVSCG